MGSHAGERKKVKNHMWADKRPVFLPLVQVPAAVVPDKGNQRRGSRVLCRMAKITVDGRCIKYYARIQVNVVRVKWAREQ